MGDGNRLVWDQQQQGRKHKASSPENFDLRVRAHHRRVVEDDRLAGACLELLVGVDVCGREGVLQAAHHVVLRKLVAQRRVRLRPNPHFMAACGGRWPAEPSGGLTSRGSMVKSRWTLKPGWATAAMASIWSKTFWNGERWYLSQVCEPSATACEAPEGAAQGELHACAYVAAGLVALHGLGHVRRRRGDGPAADRDVGALLRPDQLPDGHSDRLAHQIVHRRACTPARTRPHAPARAGEPQASGR